MATRASIRVEVADLLRRVRASRAAAVEEYNAKVVEFETRVKLNRKAIIKALETETKRLRMGGNPELNTSRYGGGVTLNLPTLNDDEVPSNPGPLNVASHDRDIALLEMASDTSLLVSTDSNWARYL